MTLGTRGMLVAGAVVAVLVAIALIRPLWIAEAVLAILSVSVVLGLLGGLAFLLIVGVEQIRRWRADRGGFGHFLKAGAPHDHPALIALLSGRPLPADGAAGTVVPDYDLHPLGTLALADLKGKLAVGDVLAMPEEDLSRATLDLGEALPERLDVTVLRARRKGDQRIAAVALGVPGRDWAETAVLAPAWRRGEREGSAAARALPTVGVDSACIAIGSPQGLLTMAKRAARDGAGLGIGPADGTNPYLDEDAGSLWRLTGTERNPVLMVLSGEGDGSYPLWAARDAGGALMGVVADFRLLPSEAMPRPAPLPERQ